MDYWIILNINSFLKSHAKRCAYCGKKLFFIEDKTIDHINPKSKGGSEKIKNKIVVCKECNQIKSNQTLKIFKKTVKEDNNLNRNILSYLEDFGDLQAPTGEYYALGIKSKFRLNLKK